MVGTVKVTGWRELDAAFRKINKDVDRQIRGILAAAAEPVRRRAEERAASEIRNVNPGDPWSQMRIGVTTKVVYVAPQRRGSKGIGPQKRKNFGPLLMDRAMEPALEENTVQTVALVEAALDSIYYLGFEKGA